MSTNINTDISVAVDTDEKLYTLDQVSSDVITSDFAHNFRLERLKWEESERAAKNKLQETINQMFELKNDIQSKNDIIEDMTIKLYERDDTINDLKDTCELYQTNLEIRELDLIEFKEAQDRSRDEYRQELTKSETEIRNILDQNRELKHTMELLKEECLNMMDDKDSEIRKYKRLVKRMKEMQKEIVRLRNMEQDYFERETEILELKKQIDSRTITDDIIESLTQRNGDLMYELNTVRDKLDYYVQYEEINDGIL